MDNIELKNRRINNPDCISEILDLIHDEYFDLEKVCYLSEEKRVEIPYCRVWHEGPRKVLRNFLIHQTHEVDVVQSVLIIRKVTNYEFIDNAKIGIYSFNTIEFSGNNLLLKCCEPLELRFELEDIDIESIDKEIRGTAKVGEGLFWSTGPVNMSNMFQQ